MKLVLLPGLHGTSQLFQPLIERLGDIVEPQLINYPADTQLNYQQLQTIIQAQLPEQDYILLGESFSGPLAYQIVLSHPTNLKAVIFVASFLQNPRPGLLNPVMIKLLQYLSLLPLPTMMIKRWLTGSEVNDLSVVLCRRALAKLPPNLLAYRLTEVSKLSGQPSVCHINAIYIQALHDKLVPASCIDVFKKVFVNIDIKILACGHFVLQAQPQECAAIVIDLINTLSDQSVED